MAPWTAGRFTLRPLWRAMRAHSIAANGDHAMQSIAMTRVTLYANSAANRCISLCLACRPLRAGAGETGLDFGGLYACRPLRAGAGGVGNTLLVSLKCDLPFGRLTLKLGAGARL